MRIMSFFAALLGLASCGGDSNKVTNVDQGQFQAQVAAGAFLLDVRTEEEYREAHLPGAVYADWYKDDFLQKVQEICPVEKEIPLAIYCRTGRRSAEAAAALSKAGYTVYNLLGGITEWISSGLKVESETE
ncbi:MAG: rhodanese-like domain-containing protein [Bacteroidales bacterium]|jgi:rhodanese-related sulfurtransferase|nr:rhodanese-like domain-containing protein [Bacteroidales bacterium]